MYERKLIKLIFELNQLILNDARISNQPKLYYESLLFIRIHFNNR